MNPYQQPYFPFVPRMRQARPSLPGQHVAILHSRLRALSPTSFSFIHFSKLGPSPPTGRLPHSIVPFQLPIAFYFFLSRLPSFNCIFSLSIISSLSLSRLPSFNCIFSLSIAPCLFRTHRTSRLSPFFCLSPFSINLLPPLSNSSLPHLAPYPFHCPSHHSPPNSLPVPTS